VLQEQPQHLQHSGQHTVSGLQQQQQEKLCDELLQKIQVMVEQLEPLARDNDKQQQQQQRRAEESSNNAVVMRLTTYAGNLLVNKPIAEQLGLPSQLLSEESPDGDELGLPSELLSSDDEDELTSELLSWDEGDKSSYYINIHNYCSPGGKTNSCCAR